MQTGFVDVSGTKLYFELSGIGTPVIFLNGFSFDCSMWDQQFALLSNKYQCLRYDMRGFGKSDVPRNGIAYSHHEDLKALTKKTGLEEPAVLIGLSMGGRVALNYALSYPTSIRALILVDSDLTGHKFNTLDTSNIYEYGRREGAKAANELWLMHELFDMARNNEDLIMKIRRIVDNYSGWHWVNKNPVKIFDLPVIELLAGINYPVLIIMGEHDTQDFHNIGHLLNARIPDSKLRIINGAGHISNMEKPEEFNEIVEKFLSTITA